MNIRFPELENKIPNCPLGKKTAKPKKPFQREMKIRSEVNPQTGQIAIKSEITATTPITAPIGINFGL